MSIDIDDFATSLLEEAKRFLEKAANEATPATQGAYLHAALLLAFCSFEAHINAVATEMATRAELSPHEKGVLLEQEVRLEDGKFLLRGLRMYRLEERFAFLFAKFSSKDIDKQAPWRSTLSEALKLRNMLSHPKEAPTITVADVSRAIQAIIDSIDALYQGIYRRGLPAANRGLQSRMEF